MDSKKFLTFFVPAAMAFAQSPSAAPKPKALSPAKAPAAKSAPRPAAAKTAPASPAKPPSDAADKVILTVGGETITQKQFETFLQQLPEQYRSQAMGPMKRQVAQQYAQVRALAQEARRRGLEQNVGVKMQMAFQADNILAGALYRELQDKANTSEAALRKYYDEHQNNYEQVQASHILIKAKGSPVPSREGKKELTEEEALAKATEIRKKIVAGEDFAKLAKEESDDTGSGQQGGSLGTFKRGSMVPPFEQAAFSLPVGQLSEPVKTQFGYHIIKVEKHDTKTFDEVKADIEKQMRPEAARKVVEELTKQANIIYDDAFFGPEQKKDAPPAAAPAAPAAPAPKP